MNHTFPGNTTCESTDPETGKRCGFPQGHQVDYQCGNGLLTWQYNPPPKKSKVKPVTQYDPKAKEAAELYGEG